MHMQLRPRWIPIAVLLILLTIGSFSLVGFARVRVASAGTASNDCRVAIVISRQEAEAAGVDWAVAKEHQRDWSSTYRCGDEAAKEMALQRAVEAKQRFLAER